MSASFCAFINSICASFVLYNCCKYDSLSFSKPSNATFSASYFFCAISNASSEASFCASIDFKIAAFRSSNVLVASPSISSCFSLLAVNFAISTLANDDALAISLCSLKYSRPLSNAFFIASPNPSNPCFIFICACALCSAALTANSADFLNSLFNKAVNDL